MPGIIPNNITDPTLRVTVTANGTAIQDKYQLESIQVHHEINRISWAELVLLDGSTTEEEGGVPGDFPGSESDSFVPGAVVVISAGYGITPVTQIFSGIIVKQAIQAREDGTFTLTITCKHNAVKMTINKKDAVFMNQQDSAILSTIIGNYGLTATVTSTTDTYETMFQKFATDWDFVLARAEFNGHIVTLGDGTVTVGPPAMSGSAVLTVGFGQSMDGFQAEMNAERQSESLTAKAWDPQTRALLESSGAEPTLNEQGNLTPKTLGTKLSQTALTLISNSPLTQAELKTWADSTLLRMRLQAIKGSVSFMGSASAAPNTILELTGVGSRFNGSAYITAVTHRLKDGEWKTTAKFGLDSPPIYQRQQFSYEGANGQLPAIQGLQLAEVVAISADPASEYRVQVKMGSTAESQTGTWARLASYYATAGSGNLFYPEVGDEVVIGFVENDPRYPVILGSLYSKGKTPPITPADATNADKGLFTKSKMKITFNETNKVITIATPGGNSITMDDTGMSIEVKDMNNNSIKTSASGVEINSPANIMIKATGSITLNGTGGVTVTSTANVAVNGMNINQSATAALSASGASSATVSSGGVMTIMGATVMIN